MPNTYNPTKSTWGQVANKQAAEAITSGNLNSKTIITTYDPIYNKLIEQISTTIYHKLKVTQRWRAIGYNAPNNNYPGMIRELIMSQRKGMNFPADNGQRPTTLNSYSIFNDTIDVRYHSAQFRWMYPWTIFDEELRRFSGGTGTTIGQLTEMKQVNAMSAQNMFMDNLKKRALNLYAKNVAIQTLTDIDISDFTALTKDDAQAWLNAVDNLIFEFENGSAAYNADHNYMQVPKSDLQMIIPRQYYLNVIRKAFPDTYNPQYFQNILPANLILIDTFADQLNREEAVVAPTYDANGMSLLNWQEGDTFTSENPNLQAVIMHKSALGFEENLDAVMFGPKDIEKLATPVRSHFWCKAWMTDLLPGVKLELNK